MNNVSRSSDDEFKKGMWDYAPDAKQTTIGYGLMAASYLLFKGKKKKK